MAKGKPAKPSVVAEYKKGVGVYINITAPSTAAKPVESIRIDRWVDTTQLYTTLTTLTGTKFFLDTNIEGTRKYAYRVLSMNSDTHSDFSDPSSFVTIIDPPDAAPTGCTAEAADNSDTVGINHTLVSTERAPVHGFYLYRSDMGAAFKQVNKYDTAANYVQNTPPADGSYRYRTWPFNNIAGAGRFMSNISGVVYTTPAAPSNMVADWDTNGNIIVTFENKSRIATKIETEHTTVIGTTTDWFPIPAPGSGNKLTHSYPERGVPHQYRFRTVTPNPTKGKAKKSAWSYSNILAAEQTPDPPSLKGPNYADPSGPITFQVLHKTVDGSPESGVRIKYRLAGEKIWAGTLTSRVGTLPYPAGKTVEWTAQTKGGDSGTWSREAAPRRMVLRNKPKVVITSPAPGSTITAPTGVVAWTGPSTKWGVRLMKNGSEESYYTGQSSRSANVRYTNGGTYTIQVRAYDGYLWSDWASREAPAVFTPPATPSLVATPDHKTGKVSLKATRGSGGLAVSNLEIIKRRPGEDWQVHLENVTSGSTYWDLLPVLRKDYEYAARAWTAAGGYAISTVIKVFLKTPWVIINYGDNLDKVAYLVTDMSLASKLENESEVVTLGSRRFGFTGPGVSESVNVSGTVPKALGSSIEAWGEAARAKRWYYRDTEGRAWEAILSAVSIGSRKDNLKDVSFSVDRLG